jgi:hypothetical protein
VALSRRARWRVTGPDQTDPADYHGRVQTINLRQTDDAFIDMLFAADVAHAKSQRVESIQAGAALALALGSLVASIKPSLTPWVAIAGFAWLAIAELGLSRYSQRWTNKATLLQERFDRDLFGLPWHNSVGEKPTDGEVARLAAEYSRDRSVKENWYVDVTGLARPYAILVCQRENLVWDEANRDRWSKFLLRVSLLWCAIGIVVGISLGWSTFELLVRWFIPSSAALWYGIRSARKHADVATIKRKLALAVSDKLAELSPSLLRSN